MAFTLANRGASPVRRSGLGPTLRTAFAAWRQRRALQTLDDHARRDLGLSESEIHIEAARPIWDVPQNWRL